MPCSRDDGTSTRASIDSSPSPHTAIDDGPESTAHRSVPLNGDAIESELVDVDESTLADAEQISERPIAGLAPLARAAAARKAAERLESMGHSPGSATAIARAVVDPAELRRRLETPAERRVPGGTLLTVDAMVWPPAICPSPTNPRGFGDTRYPAGYVQGASGRRRPLTSVRSAGGDVPELVLEVEDPQHLMEAEEHVLTYLAQVNDLTDTLTTQGVLVNLLLVPTRAVHQNGSPDITLLVSADGSSRTAAAWRLWDIDQSRMYAFAMDERVLRQHLARTVNLLELDRTKLHADDLGRLRVAQVPATIIVGFRPDHGSNLDLARAVEAIVALTHVDPPKAWGVAADLDTKGAAVLDEFVRRGVLSPSAGEWLAGMLSPQEAAQRGYSPEQDIRAAAVLKLFDDGFRPIINAGLRRLSARNIKPHRPHRLEVAAELMIRPYRAELGAAAVTMARNGIQRALQFEGFTSPWRVTRRTPEELVQAALAELQGSAPGPSARELAVLAVYWLTRYNALRQSTPTTADRREPSQLLREFLSTQHGIRMLGQAVIDGRAGRAPRAVRSDATVITTISGEDKVVDDRWLRETWPPQGAGQHSGVSLNAVSGPQSAFLQAREDLRRRVAGLLPALDALRDPRSSSGRAVADEQGLSPDIVRELTGTLQEATLRIQRYGFVYEALRGADASTDVVNGDAASLDGAVDTPDLDGESPNRADEGGSAPDDGDDER